MCNVLLDIIASIENTISTFISTYNQWSLRGIFLKMTKPRKSWIPKEICQKYVMTYTHLKIACNLLKNKQNKILLRNEFNCLDIKVFLNE